MHWALAFARVQASQTEPALTASIINFASATSAFNLW
jgi:hypothetical protein